MASPAPDADSAAAAATAAAIAATVQQIKKVSPHHSLVLLSQQRLQLAYGISVLQCYLYFRNYRKDALLLKLTVGSLLTFDTLSTIMVSHSLYTYFVTNFGNLTADRLIPWSFALENGLLTVVTIIAQWRFLRLENLDSFNIIVTVGILLLGLASFGLGLWITVHLYASAVSDPVQGTAAACEIAITVALIWYLRSKKSRSGVRTTQNMLDTLIAYAVCRGILTALTQIVFLILVVSGRDESTISVSTPYQFSTGEEESATRSLPLAFIRPKMGSLGQGDTIGSLDCREQYGFSDPHANDTKMGMISDAVPARPLPLPLQAIASLIAVVHQIPRTHNRTLPPLVPSAANTRHAAASADASCARLGAHPDLDKIGFAVHSGAALISGFEWTVLSA
ncbi:hypothetical protein C8J57DRAFT_1628563 [Mycena rebaudengoi]|nr:hypothetical protein C8J57DRAFT_1628563 [Mycena rebaudengoi]